LETPNRVTACHTQSKGQRAQIFRVVVASMAVLPPRRIRTFSLEGLRIAVTGVGDSIRARLEMSTWVLTQYRDLMLRS
jgi:hypothetical protein